MNPGDQPAIRDHQLVPQIGFSIPFLEDHFSFLQLAWFIRPRKTREFNFTPGEPGNCRIKY